MEGSPRCQFCQQKDRELRQLRQLRIDTNVTRAFDRNVMPRPYIPQPRGFNMRQKEWETLPSPMTTVSNFSTSSFTPLVKLPPPAPAPAANDIPDGGLLAWYQVLGAFFLVFNSWGIVNSFGVYQTNYTALLASEATASDVSWIGSLQASLLFSVGIVTGPLFDWGYLRSLLLSGSFLVVAGMMLASICEHYWQLMLTQGLLVGIGCGCLFAPSIAIIPTYFKKKKAIAMAIGTAGSALGGVIYPVLFRQVQPAIGFRWATRVNAFVMLATLAIPLAVMKMRIKPPTRRRLVDLSAWKEAPYVLFNIGFFFGLIGMYVPFFYIQSYGLDLGIIDDNLSFYLLVIINAGSLARIVSGFVADRIGCFNVLVPSALLASLVAYLWIPVRDASGLVVFSVLYGIFSGIFISLPPTATVNLSPSLGEVGVRLGMTMLVASFGVAIGNPIAGAILRGGWLGLQAWGASCLAIGALFLAAARIAKVGWSLKGKF